MHSNLQIPFHYMFFFFKFLSKQLFTIKKKSSNIENDIKNVVSFFFFFTGLSNGCWTVLSLLFSMKTNLVLVHFAMFIKVFIVKLSNQLAATLNFTLECKLLRKTF